MEIEKENIMQKQEEIRRQIYENYKLHGYSYGIENVEKTIYLFLD